MPKEMNAVRFRCPDCNVPVPIGFAVWHSDSLVLCGDCEQCGEQIHFSADKISISLIQSQKPEPNRKVH